MTAHITDHRSAALARLAQQLKGKPNYEALYNVCLRQIQEIEDALWQLFVERWLDTAVGVQLDVLGRIIGEPRGNSANDAAYVLRLRARQRTNRSSGTIEQILSVFHALGFTPESLRIEPSFPGALTLYIEDVAIDEATATLYASFLKSARLAAVEAFLHTSSVLAADTFTLPPSAFVAVVGFESPFPNALRVNSTAAFPSSGYLIFPEVSGGDQDVWSYSSKTAETFEGMLFRHGPQNDRAIGELVLLAPLPASELAADFEGPGFASEMPIKDTSAFPDAGFVTLGYGTAGYRVFSYNGKTANSFENVVATDLGTGDVFASDSLVVSCAQVLSSTDEPTMGGHLSSIKEA